MFIVKVTYCQDKVCTSQDDCDETHCCATLETKRAGHLKRFIFGSSKSVCKPRRYQGQACHVYLNHDFSNPDIFLDYCPCEEGLECRGTTIDGQIHHNPKCLPMASTTTTTSKPPMTTTPP
ncbi:hypothetical protein KUTeg_020963 [Tegillarca granosa]|uniref:Prokineticin domain-containing protein n=1 Tax=Tegillarca granosa TaxID=220873 RepID=A0ABQ9EDQ0_TEGGR|nr:hypothetical protein KUTeg_020963 [Tegillarca granosa]